MSERLSFEPDELQQHYYYPTPQYRIPLPGEFVCAHEFVEQVRHPTVSKYSIYKLAEFQWKRTFGDRIKAKVVTNGILFKDFDRHIDGFIAVSRLFLYEYELQNLVMLSYDVGNYEYDARASKLEWEE